MEGRGVARTRDVILDCIVQYIKVHGYPPTVREICDMCGLKSTNTVHNHIQRLITDGKLETDAEYGSSRALRVPGYAFVKKENHDDED